MKIRTTVTVEVDPDEWARLYGVPRDDVAQDVKDYIAETVRSSSGIRATAPLERAG